MRKKSEIDSFAALVTNKLLEKNKKQSELAREMNWSNRKMNNVIYGKNHHSGPNQTGLYQRTDLDCFLLALHLDPSPEFLSQLILNRNEIVAWGMQAFAECDSVVDILQKLEDDDMHFLDEYLAADEQPDYDE